MENKKRLIDANDLLREMKFGAKPAYLLVQDAPTVDAVEVVRCRDCKHREDRLYCRLRKQPVIVMNTDFCSYGERKDNE